MTLASSREADPSHSTIESRQPPAPTTEPGGRSATACNGKAGLLRKATVRVNENPQALGVGEDDHAPDLSIEGSHV